MGIGKRERIIVGALLLLLTPYVVWQWGISPDAYWRRAELRRRSLEKELAKKKKTINEETAVRAMIAGYEQLVHRYPKHPKSAAARVIMVGLIEGLEGYVPRILILRAELAAFYADKRAAGEIKKLLQHPQFADIASEVLACIEPRKITPIVPNSLLTMTVDMSKTPPVHLLDVLSGKKIALPLRGSITFVEGAQAWQHDLDRFAFVTQSVRQLPHTTNFTDKGIRWTIWVADLKAGRLRAFLPSHLLPDLAQMEEPLLVWSADGKRLKCGSETFVVE